MAGPSRGGRIDFEKVADEALRRCPGLLEGWFPAGRMDGIEFCIGDITGNPGRSLKVNVRTGCWADWAQHNLYKGGDLISLYAAMHKLEQGEAARELAALFWGDAADARGPLAGDGRAARAERRSGPVAADNWTPVVPPPVEVDPAGAGCNGHRKLGPATRTFAYRGAAGELLFFVCRWDIRPGEKTVMARTYGHLNGQAGWHWKHPADPRPLYGLDALAAAPADRPVLLVEGEPTADAAPPLVPQDGDGPAYTVMSWEGGTGAVGRADWSPLAGRRVTIWPDADQQVYGKTHPKAGQLLPPAIQPGFKAALAIAVQLEEIGCEVFVVVPPGEQYAGGDVAGGWDLADAVDDGWTRGDMARYLDDHEIPHAAFRERFPEPEEEALAPTAAGGGGGDDAGDKYAARKADLPIVPLGKNGKTYFFLTQLGELMPMRFAEFSESGLRHLFDGRLEWMYAHFPAYDKDGNPRPGGISYKAVEAWLMRECANAGLFDPGTPVRGPGVWRDANGEILVHAGNALSVVETDDEGTARRAWRGAGAFLDGVIYPAAPRLQRPGPTMASAAAGRQVLDGLRLWEFARLPGEDPQGEPILRDVLAGFIGQAMLGGAPAWRAHVYVLAALGSGKSWLAGYVSAVLGAGAHGQLNNFTEAFLRQAMTGQARAMILDEAEHDENNWRIRAVIELIRHMSSGDGARAGRGSADGTHKNFDVTGCAYLSSILQGPLKPQDRSRITVIRLMPLPAGVDAGRSADRVLEATRTAREVSPRLRARAIAGWPRYQDTFRLYRDAFLTLGCRPREADQFATFAAGRDLLVRDDVPLVDEVDADIERWRPLVREALQSDDEANEGQECLTHLFTSPAHRWQSGEMKTVGELVALGRELASSEYRTQLRRLGLRLEVHGRGVDDRLIVANKHQGLDAVFAGTRWAGGTWRDALQYLGPDVRPWHAAVNFAGVKQRGLALPGRYLPEGETERSGEGGVPADRSGSID